MNNEETPSTSPTSPLPPAQAPTQPASTLPQTPHTPDAPSVIPSPVDTPADTWMTKEHYEAIGSGSEKQRVEELKKSRRISTFYTLLRISGLLLFIMYVGMLVWPFYYGGRGNCSGNFIGIAFWLNPISYVFLLATGIVGATIKHRMIRTLGVSLIAASPIGWFITGVVIIGDLMCGV